MVEALGLELGPTAQSCEPVSAIPRNGNFRCRDRAFKRAVLVFRDGSMKPESKKSPQLAGLSRRSPQICEFRDCVVETVGLELKTHHPVLSNLSPPFPGTGIFDAETGRLKSEILESGDGDLRNRNLKKPATSGPFSSSVRKSANFEHCVVELTGIELPAPHPSHRTRLHSPEEQGQEQVSQPSTARSMSTRRQSISYSRSTTGGRQNCQVRPAAKRAPFAQLALQQTETRRAQCKAARP